MLLVYTAEITERKKYIFKFIFSDLFQIAYTLTDQKDVFTNYSGPCINYSTERIHHAFFIFEEALLTQKAYHANEKPAIGIWNANPVIYFQQDKGDIPFDIFAASFYLISRYEEYSPLNKDAHGRFKPEASIAFQENFLQKPIVNIWANAFSAVLCEKFPELQIQKRPFEYISTFDIDSYWAYRGKSLFKTLGGYFKSILHGRIKECVDRTYVLLGQKKDPFDTFELQSSWEKEFHLKHMYFFHLGDPGKNDRIIASENQIDIQEKIQNLSQTHKTGIHPSYQSNVSKEQFRKEFGRYQKYTGKSPQISRQHFLKMNAPETYRQLSVSGIKEDYTMGYAQKSGFRAGVAFPFRFYDLENETETPLLIYPFAVMDGTLKDYMKLPPEKAEQTIIELMNEVKASGGVFISILHNHTIHDEGEWKGWKKVFETMFFHGTNKPLHA